MKTRYKHVHFVKKDDDAGVWWGCYDNRTKDRLGDVEWCSDWRQYAFTGVGYARLTTDRLRDISDFMEKLKEARDG